MHQKIVDYKTVIWHEPNWLAEKVKADIAAGWQPHGPSNVIPGDQERVLPQYYQHMVKYETVTDMAVSQYKVATGITLPALIEKVNLALASGWQVSGGVVINPEVAKESYLQALVRTVHDFPKP